MINVSLHINVRNCKATLLLLLFLLPLSSIATVSPRSPVFITTAGTGPDKWASIWLLTRYLHATDIQILPSAPTHETNGITFDFTGAQFNRTGNSSTLSAIIEHYGLATEEVLTLNSLVSEIEFEPWNTDKSIASSVTELGFRNMQLRYGRMRVGRNCYMQFFDNLLSTWQADKLDGSLSPDSLIPAESCLDGQRPVQPEELALSVPEIEQHEVLQKLARNQKVLFIDTRETSEFAEGHIPASLNLKLREVSEATALGLPTADIIVAYCVKDFRGYEAARKLRRYGLNAVIMKPYGIKGWIDAGLPIAGPRGTNKEDALRQLDQHLQTIR